MTDINRSIAPDEASTFPEIRVVTPAAIVDWVRAGWQDLTGIGRASLFYGACFALGGWLIQIVFAHAYPLFAGLTTGFLLLGPFLAMSLYDLSRRRERGEPPRLLSSLAAWRANLSNLSNLALFAAVLAVVMLIWARASVVIFALFYDGGLPTFTGVMRAVFAFEQPIFALTYFAVGGFFAGFVFVISVVAVPLMLDRRTDAITAAIASLLACGRNPLTMLTWGATIVVLVGLGIATLFAGLIVVMPLVGHATWHAYRALIAPAKTGS